MNSQKRYSRDRGKSIQRTAVFNILSQNFRPEEKYPLVVFLHGAGTRSENIEALQQNACVANLKKHQDRGFVILAPLCSVHDWLFGFTAKDIQ